MKVRNTYSETSASSCGLITLFQAGISVPRTSGAQADYGRRIRKSNMKVGDLMYFGGHIGIFVGWRDGRRLMLDAPSSGGRVSVRHPWTSSWTAYTLR